MLQPMSDSDWHVVKSTHLEQHYNCSVSMSVHTSTGIHMLLFLLCSTVQAKCDYKFLVNT